MFSLEMSQDDDMSGDWNDAVMVCLLWWFMEFVVARGDFVQKSRSNSSSKAVAEKLKNNVSAGIQLVNFQVLTSKWDLLWMLSSFQNFSISSEHLDCLWELVLLSCNRWYYYIALYRKFCTFSSKSNCNLNCKII